MAGPMNPLPTSADDPRLRGWYHTIELAPGIVTPDAVYDHRPIVDHVLPASLEGKTVLDVGTADGFWAFEMERRGAKRVVALDIAVMEQSDVLPRRKAQLPDDWARSENYCAERFWTAHAMRGSQVEYRTGSIYELSPETFGTFDVVYFGSLLVHLFNPLQALINIRSVTREMVIAEGCGLDPVGEPIEAAFPDRPYMKFGSLDAEGNVPGRHCMYWYFTPRALCDMLVYAGFGSTEPRSHYRVVGPGGGDCPMTTVIGHVSPGEMTHVAPPAGTKGYWQLQNELTQAQAEIAALQAQLRQYEGLGPRSIEAARRLQRLSKRFPRVSSTFQKVNRSA